MKIYGNLYKFMKMNKINGHLRKSMKIYENPRKSMKIDENLWKSMKINEINEHVWDISVSKKEDGYIVYSERMSASHFCLPNRNQSFKQRKWKSRFSGKHGLWSAKHGSKSLIWWKPEMIPRPMQTFCPSRFPVKPR